MVILYIKRLSAILAFFFLFIGCAVSPELRDSLDPYEEQNRKVHEFNERVIENLIEPVTGAYVEATPPFVRDRITDFFENIDLRVYLRDVEVVLIESALKKSDGVVSKASDLLKINRTTLIEKMKKLGMMTSN